MLVACTRWLFICKSKSVSRRWKKILKRQRRTLLHYRRGFSVSRPLEEVRFCSSNYSSRQIVDWNASDDWRRWKNGRILTTHLKKCQNKTSVCRIHFSRFRRGKKKVGRKTSRGLMRQTRRERRRIKSNKVDDKFVISMPLRTVMRQTTNTNEEVANEGQIKSKINLLNLYHLWRVARWAENETESRQERKRHDHNW